MLVCLKLSQAVADLEKNSDWVLSQKNLAKNEIFVHFIQIWKF